MNKAPCIYAAGRMHEKSRTRFGITDNVIFDSDADLKTPAIAQITAHQYKWSEYRYTGPYTGACDHGCAHSPLCKQDSVSTRGSSSHAMALTGCFEEQARWSMSDVFLRSLDGIRKADYVFVWIEDYECYGTLVEVGVAHTLGKPIYLAHKPTIEPCGDMWFAFECATKTAAFMSSEEAYAAFLHRVGRDQGDQLLRTPPKAVHS